MTKAELRKFQQGNLRRFAIVFILIAFAIGLMVAWIAPSVVTSLLSVVVLILAGFAFEARYRQSKMLAPRKKSLPSNSIMMKKKGVTR